MKKVLFISISIFIICLLVGCKKDEPTIYKGRVVEEKSNRPVPNAKIEVKTCKGNFNTGQLSCTTIDSTFTDSEGNFSYPVPNADKYTSLDFFANKQHFYPDYGTNFYGTGTVVKEIRITPKAWIDIRMIREAPFDEESIFVDGPNAIPFYDNGFKYMDNYSKYEGIYESRGNDSLFMLWRIRYLDGRPETKLSKKIYLKGLDTTVFELRF